MNVRIKKHDLLVIEVCNFPFKKEPEKELRKNIEAQLKTGLLILPDGYKATLYKDVYINNVCVREVFKVD